MLLEKVKPMAARRSSFVLSYPGRQREWRTPLPLNLIFSTPKPQQHYSTDNQVDMIRFVLTNSTLALNLAALSTISL
jgi:hypothetical protein